MSCQGNSKKHTSEFERRQLQKPKRVPEDTQVGPPRLAKNLGKPLAGPVSG